MINTDIILNVFLGILIYNIVLKAFGATMLKHIMKTNVGKETGENIRKSFEQRIEELKKEKTTKDTKN